MPSFSSKHRAQAVRQAVHVCACKPISFGTIFKCYKPLDEENYHFTLVPHVEESLKLSMIT